MSFRLSYRINMLEGSLEGDLPTVLADFTALIGHRLCLDPDWRNYMPPSVVELRELIRKAGKDIVFDLDYAPRMPAMVDPAQPALKPVPPAVRATTRPFGA
ncbi:hypothetical protein [Falsirhodobacter xinxiangensis]|uniref:hypothetical protein n=1 Tax=Falsirhodobacter xinxiangensis TaxID=2530049 RepID=UPI0010AAF1F8|nr:hypothetical protein [Rhodobacter xinxiangensis]